MDGSLYKVMETLILGDYDYEDFVVAALNSSVNEGTINLCSFDFDSAEDKIRVFYWISLSINCLMGICPDSKTNQNLLGLMVSSIQKDIRTGWPQFEWGLMSTIEEIDALIDLFQSNITASRNVADHNLAMGFHDVWHLYTIELLDYLRFIKTLRQNRNLLLPLLGMTRVRMVHDIIRVFEAVMPEKKDLAMAAREELSSLQA